MKRDDFKISCQALIYAHKKCLRKQHCSTKKSSFQLSKWRALTSMLVIYQVNLLVTFMKKKEFTFLFRS